MRGAVAVACREMWDRRMILFVALVFGILPFAAPLLPGVGTADRWSAVCVSAVFLALGFGVVLAASLGATVVARDVASGRIGFDLARPVSVLAVWAGRMGAAVLLTTAAIAIVGFPALLLASGAVGAAPSASGAGLLWAVALIVPSIMIVPLAHIVGVIVRSHSRWRLLDVGAVAVIVVVAARALRRFLDAFAPEKAAALLLPALAAVILVLWIASAVQLVRGRADIVAGHRAQSLVLWPLLAAVALGLAAYSVWFVAAGPEDLAGKRRLWSAPAGTWLAVTGTSAHDDYRPTFLLETETGRSMRIGANSWVDGEILFSGDGTRAVWLQREGDGTSSVTARTIDLTSAPLRPSETRVRFSALMSPILAAVSPTGRFLAGIQHDSVAVHDLDLGRTILSFRLQHRVAHGKVSIAFHGERFVRIYDCGLGTLRAHEIDLDSGELRHFESEGVTGDWLHWTPDHQRLLFIEGWGRRAAVLDGTDGSVLWRMPDAEAGTNRSIDFLSDGRVVAAIAGNRAVPATEVYSPEGVQLHRIEFEGAADIPALGYEIVPGRVLVGFAVRSDSAGWTDRRLYSVHAATGAFVAVEGTDALPFRWEPSAGWAPPRPGSARSRLLMGSDCEVALIDPDDLSVRRILGGDCSQ